MLGKNKEQQNEKQVNPNETDPNIITIENIQHPLIKEKKLSMFCKPNKVKAIIPDFSLPDEQLKSMFGLQRKENRWYVANREWYPDPLKEDSIIVIYDGTLSDGTPDIGYCSQAEFCRIYTHTDKYDEGDIVYIDPSELKKGKMVEATKCATGEFCLVPAGTKIVTNEGKATIEPWEILIINDFKNSIFRQPIEKILEKYVGDMMNPASRKAFGLLKKFQQEKETAKSDELPRLFNKLVSEFNAIERQVKVYESFEDKSSVESLREDFKRAAELVNKLDVEISPKIDSLQFGERMAQAKEVIRDILNDDSLTSEQQDAKITYVKALLLPKTNNHQHLKGSVPKETLLERARIHGFSDEQISAINKAYEAGADGFDNLDQFNKAYGIIGSAIRTPEDYRAAVNGIMKEATKTGQLTVEIRCAVIGQRDETGKAIDPHDATENILRALDESRAEIGEEAPKTGFTFLGYRGRDWKPEEVIEHARLAIEFAQKYPDRKFSFDIAGPEDTGYNPTHFKEAFDLIKQYNDQVNKGEIQGEHIGVTVHAGETPTYNQGEQGHKAVLETIGLGADRIGHCVQAVSNPDTMATLQDSHVTVEICGVCNITSIPLNTEGMAIHPVQEFIKRGVPITICTDNDAICGTNITKEYAMFLFTGHNQLMNWDEVKKAAIKGITSSFIADADKIDAMGIFLERIRAIERMVVEERLVADKKSA